MTGEAGGLRKSVHSSQLWGNKHIMIKQIGQKRSKEPHKSSVRIDCGVKNCPCIVRMSLHRLPGLSRRGLHYYIVARARKHQQKSPIHSCKNLKKLALAYTALHTTHAQRIQILRNKIVNAQDPSKYLLYCHTLYNAMAWSNIGDNARALSTHVPGSALSKDDVMGWGEMSWGWLCVDNYASGAGTDWAGVIFYTWVAQIHFHWQTWTPTQPGAWLRCTLDSRWWWHTQSVWHTLLPGEK